jgi:hypothetical protein
MGEGDAWAREHKVATLYSSDKGRQPLQNVYMTIKPADKRNTEKEKETNKRKYVRKCRI